LEIGAALTLIPEKDKTVEKIGDLSLSAREKCGQAAANQV